MGTQRLKIDPRAIDLMLAAIVLTRENRVQHAGHYAFVAIGRLLIKNLPDETGPTTALNFRRRLERLCREKEFPEELKDEVYSHWKQIKYYIDHKVSYVPSYRGRKIKNYVKLVQQIFEEHSGVDFEEIISGLTIADLERLHVIFGDNLLAEPEEETQFSGFIENDFENLFALRDALAQMGVELAKKMKGEKSRLPGPNLSRTDFTSAYLTLSFNGNPLRAAGEEANFRILLTNQYLMAGLYLGERSKATRQRYYECFRAGKMKQQLGEFSGRGGELLDVFWYYNLENRLLLKKLLHRPGDYQALVKEKIERAKENLNRTPCTWNILLPAKIWEKKEACELGPALLEEIWELYPPTYRIIESLV